MQKPGKWNPFNGLRRHKGGQVEVPPKPKTLEEIKAAHQQVTFLIGHNTRQKDVVLPRMIGELHQQADELEKEYEKLERAQQEKMQAALANAPKDRDANAGAPAPTLPETKAA
jgi:hypothetical protein